MPESEETPAPEEIARRRDEVVKRMLNTPPQPRPVKPGKPKPSTSTGPASEAP